MRYPGDIPELPPGQEKIAFDLAKRTRDAIEGDEMFSEYVVPLRAID